MAPYAELVGCIAAERGLGLRRLSFPIPDLGVIDDSGYDTIVAAIRDAAAGGAVYLHCWGGVGRTGTVVGCYLIDGGLSDAGALERLRVLRAGTRTSSRPAPETSAQLDLLRRRAERRRAGDGG